MQDEAVELSSSRAVYGSSALHHLDLRGAAARLDAAAAPREVLLDQDLREVNSCGEIVVAWGSEFVRGLCREKARQQGWHVVGTCRSRGAEVGRRSGRERRWTDKWVGAWEGGRAWEKV